jgi:hypothetical protein
MTADTKQAEQSSEPTGEIPRPAPQKITTTASDDSEFACFLDTAKFNQLWRVAQVFAASELVPGHYRQKPNNCFVAMQMSIRLDVDPMMFMQNTFVIQGKPGMESKLVIALINARGPFEGPIQWKFTGTGDAWACTAYAKHKATGEVCEATVTWDMATKEGWTTKKGSKWVTMPRLMFQYRSAVFLGRLYCPECLMGMRTTDELVDITSPTFGDAQEASRETIEQEAGSEIVDAELTQLPIPKNPQEAPQKQATAETEQGKPAFMQGA